MGAGLARDANDAAFQLHHSDAIAGKPAPTFERDCQTDIEEPRVTANPHSVLPSPLQTAKLLAAEFALTAVERDERGGTPKAERDALRQSGLLALSIPTPVSYTHLRAHET